MLPAGSGGVAQVSVGWGRAWQAPPSPAVAPSQGQKPYARTLWSIPVRRFSRRAVVVGLLRGDAGANLH